MTTARFTEQSAHRLLQLMSRFASFAETSGVDDAATIAPDLVEGFVRARSRSLQVPSPATMHLRRSAVRLLFQEGRRLGSVSSDPTLDLLLPPRTNLRTRPLTDEEMLVCRSACLRTLSETRQPAAWALAEATARSAEISEIRVRDLDLASGVVLIRGSTKTDA